MGFARDAGWADTWQRSWDRLEADYVPDRELRIRALLDVVDAITGPAPTVVDLACGTGTVTCRLLDRLPAARSIAVDVDPVLLTIASATFADDDRVRVVTPTCATRRGGGGPRAAGRCGAHRHRAALASGEHRATRLPRSGSLGPPGGVVAHAEQMPLVGLPSLGAGLAEVQRRRRAGTHAADRDGWDRWWEQAARDPALRSAAAKRRTVFESSYPTEEFSPPADWHVAALRAAGFAEADVVWRSGAGAVVAAVR